MSNGGLLREEARPVERALIATEARTWRELRGKYVIGMLEVQFQSRDYLAKAGGADIAKQRFSVFSISFVLDASS